MSPPIKLNFLFDAKLAFFSIGSYNLHKKRRQKRYYSQPHRNHSATLTKKLLATPMIRAAP